MIHGRPQDRFRNHLCRRIGRAMAGSRGQLFFPQFSLLKPKNLEGWLARAWSIKSETAEYAVVGVLSVAMAYTLGAAVSRLAEESFNDDDLYLHGLPTEDQIRASVYRRSLERALVDAVKDDKKQRRQRHNLTPDNSEANPEETPHWLRGSLAHETLFDVDRTRQIFSIQEAALLLQGEDKVSKIRLLHQQLNVLRGAAFDGLLTCLLCLLGWNAKESWGPWRSKWWRAILPVGLLAWALYGLLWNHLGLFPDPRRFWLRFDDPPFMELTLLLFCGGGLYVAWRGTKGSWPQGAGFASLLLAALAYCGWYSTEILYDQQIIYSFYALHPLIKLTQ